ncbi:MULTISPECIES: alpha/beta fold hydrolase [unclassified Mesorhizobium]|uniref:alpha/beta hydrolase n=1 Tax=unclassified Mesorhizobium TaxID=325217 RepID=UPI0008F2B868|nr:MULTISPECIES: alpha/beta fold hydrolase [unclassified Mesorhizobium]RJG44959.1 alpha/beta fold hydrolase [Mesorhizobium sp. DCY119]SFT79378.1 Esterase/lipase [Mesorhizobium sp. YR577]
MASIGLKVIRGVFGAAEHIAPRLGGRAAFELFCRTPDPKKLSAGERRAVEAARGFMAEARHHRLKVGSGCVSVHEFRPEGHPATATVLVIHGWRSRTEYMRALIDGYRKAGFRVMSLDLPGHGGSTGRRLNMAMAVEATAAAAQWFGPFAAVVGHSFGGAVAACAASGMIKGTAPLPTERLVMIAAPNALTDVLNGFRRHTNVGEKSARALDKQIKRISGHPMAEFVASRYIAQMQIPTLVIHAPNDAEVPASDAKTLAAAGDHVRLLWAENLGHRRILSDQNVVSEAVGFVEQPREQAVVH